MITSLVTGEDMPWVIVHRHMMSYFVKAANEGISQSQKSQ